MPAKPSAARVPTIRIHQVTLRPPPGFRFVNWSGGDVELQFPEGQEDELVRFLETWINGYIKPQCAHLKAQRMVREAAEDKKRYEPPQEPMRPTQQMAAA